MFNHLIYFARITHLYYSHFFYFTTWDGKAICFTKLNICFLWQNKNIWWNQSFVLLSYTNWWNDNVFWIVNEQFISILGFLRWSNDIFFFVDQLLLLYIPCQKHKQDKIGKNTNFFV